MVICPLQFHVEKAPSKLQQERIISSVERYKYVVRFGEFYRYFVHLCASLWTIQRFLQVAAISSCIHTPNCFEFTRPSNFRHAPLMKTDSSSSSIICQTTGPKILPKRFLHIVRSSASSFNWQYPLLSLRSTSSFLRLLPRLLFISICPFIFPSITCCRRQFLRKMWQIQLAFGLSRKYLDDNEEEQIGFK
jgi:hypothetical protein